MTTPTPVCPECARPFLLDHPAGALTVQHIPNGCTLGARRTRRRPLTSSGCPTPTARPRSTGRRRLLRSPWLQRSACRHRTP